MLRLERLSSLFRGRLSVRYRTKRFLPLVQPSWPSYNRWMKLGGFREGKHGAGPAWRAAFGDRIPAGGPEIPDA
ncbi:hypothetical protein GCM10007886_50330 [Methylobacterium gregans]|nr:hypothetical protein GCM10007886_50330 [Methylobacterium gregans]